MDVAVIGIGGFAAKMIEQIKRHPHLKIRYGYHPNEEKAKQWDENLGTASLDDVFGPDHIEAVFVLTPTHYHAQYCLKAIAAQKHMFVEKPLTHTLTSARDLIKNLRNIPLKCMVGHSFRRQPWHREIKKLIDSGKIGKIFNIIMNHSHGAIFNLPETSWRKDRQAHPEGPLATVGTHYFDLLHYWLGKVRFVDAVLGNVAGRSTAPDANAVLMGLENDITVLLQTNYCQCSEQFVHIYGTEGTIYCERNRLSLRVGRDRNRAPSTAEHIPLSEDNCLMEEIDEFYRGITQGAKITTGPQEGLNNVIVLDACRVSHEKERRVYLDEYGDYFQN